MMPFFGPKPRPHPFLQSMVSFPDRFVKVPSIAGGYMIMPVSTLAKGAGKRKSKRLTKRKRR